MMRRKRVYICFLILYFFIISVKAIPAPAVSRYLRGDDAVEFRWRFGYSEFPVDTGSRTGLADAARGTYGWYDGMMWSGGYCDWEEEVVQGANLLFRSGSPYARAVRCISEPVPLTGMGNPETFAIPLSYTLGSEERISVALRIIGQEEETIVLNLLPRRETTVVGGRLKVTFYALRLEQPSADRPTVRVTGMLHIRVYPGLLKYSERMMFEFNSLTRHMDVESGMWIGSLWKDLSRTDVVSAWQKSGLSDIRLEQADSLHRARLQIWNKNASERSKRLQQPAQIRVFCSSEPEIWDRGEMRVQAYSGNPVKDFQYGAVTGGVEETARSLKQAFGRPFSLFRYQHHHLPWQEKHPERLDTTEQTYLDQWLRAASETSGQVVLDLQISPVIKAYKAVTRMGKQPLPAAGIPGFPWEDLKQGYKTTIRHAKKVCPQLRIIQMPYEFDNIADEACHRDAHYRLFQVLYQAVNEINRELPASDRLQVAGLGSNTPYRWGFIDGFLERYKQDSDPSKRLDYITWHTYLFPGTSPNICKGFGKELKRLLEKHRLPLDLPVLVDESGLAEPSTIEDLSDLAGASRKEAAMACFAATIHHWYLKETGNFLPVTGGGFHFGLLTYGRQHVLSPYAKGILLRSRLFEHQIRSEAVPCDRDGYGLYSQATVAPEGYRILIWTASPSIFYEKAVPLAYPQARLILENLPERYKNKKVRVVIESVDPEEEASRKILESAKCQTLPLTRGAGRYDISFTPQEVKILNSLPATVCYAKVGGDRLVLPLDIRAYSMYLVKVELEK